MVTKQLTSMTTRFFAVGLLLALSGCNWGSKKKTSMEQATDGSQVLYTIDQRPVVTAAQFEDYYNQVLASDPRLQSMAGFLPNLKKEIFDALANQELLVIWADNQGMFDSEDFQKNLNQGIQQIRRMHAAKKFGEAKVGKITVTESEIRDYYEQHKDPELVATPGGIKAAGIEFATKDAATAFFNKVKNTPNSVITTAKMEKLAVKSFPPINKYSFEVDMPIKAALESKTSFPVVVMAQGSDKKWWVVVGESKQETKFRPLDEVRDAISGAVEREKGMKQFSDEINKLKETMTITEDAEYFAQPSEGQKPDLEQLLQQVGDQQAQAQGVPAQPSTAQAA